MRRRCLFPATRVSFRTHSGQKSSVRVPIPLAVSFATNIFHGVIFLCLEYSIPDSPMGCLTKHLRP